MKVPIRHYLFEVREPCFGAVISPDAQRVLTCLRAHALREIWNKKIPQTSLLNPDQLELTRAQFAAFDAQYYLPAPISIREVHTLDTELEWLRAEGYPASDAEALARRRYAARIGLEDPKLEDLI